MRPYKLPQSYLMSEPASDLRYRLLEAGQGAVDHLIAGGEREAEITRQFNYCSRQTENMVIREDLPESPIVGNGRTRHQIKRAFGRMNVITHAAERFDHVVAFDLQ